MEYFNSTHGARKGLADTALKTANSGYLTVVSSTWRRTPLSTSATAARIMASTCAPSSTRAGGGFARLACSRPHGRGRRGRAGDRRHHRAEGDDDRGAPHRADQQVRHPGDQDPVGADLRDPQRRVRHLLTGATSPAARPSNGRSGRRHRGAVHRRAGHPAHHAYLPHRRRRAARDSSFVETNFEGTVRVRNRNVARNSEGDLVVMARNLAIVVVDHDGTERAVHRIQYGSRLKVDEGDTVKRAASASRSGTPTPARSSPKWTAPSASRIWWKASP